MNKPADPPKNKPLPKARREELVRQANASAARALRQGYSRKPTLAKLKFMGEK
jgi:hypothetical protein